MQAEYAADKPNDCRFCYFWKNDSTGCSLGKDNCYYLIAVPPKPKRNGWRDEDGRVYIIFTVEEIRESLSCGNKKAISLLDELENKVNLIERKRQGLGKPNLIYVKNFCSVDFPVERHFLKCQNDTSGNVKTRRI